MKIILFILTTVLFYSCFGFDEQKKFIAKYKIDSSTNIEVYTIGYGATTKDFTEIHEIDLSKDELLKKIEGDYSDYKIKISQVKDDLFKITFTDTAIFKGMSRSYTFNINKR